MGSVVQTGLSIVIEFLSNAPNISQFKNHITMGFVESVVLTATGVT
jgi:hypothetical protein